LDLTTEKSRRAVIGCGIRRTFIEFARSADNRYGSSRSSSLKGKALGHPAICRHGRMWQRDENAASWLHTQTTPKIYGIKASDATVEIN
jgi:hypothetical protein